MSRLLKQGRATGLLLALAEALCELLNNADFDDEGVTMNDTLPREVYDSREAGRNLALAIQQGTPIHTIPCPIRLRSGEQCVGTSQVGLMQDVGANVDWTEKHGGGWGLGSILFMGAANAIGNSARKASAMRQAAAQWRMVDQGRMWLTNERFAIQGSEWINLWHENVNMSQCDGLTIELHYDGMPPTRLRMAYADWWYVMMQWIGFHVLTMPGQP
jgi:hypothetical protein